MNTLKLAAAFVGEDGDKLQHEPILSQQKIILMAMSLAVPVLLWLVQGTMLARTMGHPWLPALGIGLVCALIIYFFERIILLSPVMNGPMTWARVGLALSIALVGGFVMDLAIYHDDIEAQIDRKYEQKIDSLDRAFLRTNLVEEQKLVAIVQEKQANLQAQQTNYLSEIQDKRPGTGPISDAIRDELMRPAHSELIAAEKQLEAYRRSVEARKLAHRRQAKRENGLELRMDLMNSIVTRSWHSLLFFIAITAVFFFFEMLVILTKKSLPKTALDVKRDAEEEKQKALAGTWAKSHSPDPRVSVN